MNNKILSIKVSIPSLCKVHKFLLLNNALAALIVLLLLCPLRVTDFLNLYGLQFSKSLTTDTRKTFKLEYAPFNKVFA